MGKGGGIFNKLKLNDPLKHAKSTYSIISLNDVTDKAAEIWDGLPTIVRNDPALVSFRSKYERVHGVTEDHDPDPLPNHDHSDDETNTNSGIKKLNNVKNLSTDTEMQTLKTNQLNDTGGDHEDHNIHSAHAGHHPQRPKLFTKIKIFILVAVWLAFTVILTIKGEKELTYRQISVPANSVKDILITNLPKNQRLEIHLKGAFLPQTTPTTNYNDTNSLNQLEFYFQITQDLTLLNNITNQLNKGSNNNQQLIIQNMSRTFNVGIVPEHLIDQTAETKLTFSIDIDYSDYLLLQSGQFRLNLYLNTNYQSEGLPLQFTFDPAPIDKSLGVLLAAILLLGLYGMIIWEVVHRTFAAMIASTMAIAILAAMNARPTMSEIISWIDVETLLLLFGMMILVAILSESGVFDYLAVYSYKITGGRVWPLLNCLCLFTAILSSFLDNVTTVLLMTPVSIRLCEVLSLNPIPILMAMVIFSNIGGTATPVGDPPNVIIASNKYISTHGINFMNFTLHMTIGILLVMVQSFIQIRYQFRDMNKLRFSEPTNIRELRQEIAVWQRAAASLSSYSKDEDLVRETLEKKVLRLQRQLKKSLTTGSVPVANYRATLEEMQAKYPMRNKKLLIQSSIVLIFVIAFFFLHSMPHIQRLSLGWTALLGACLLLILADRQDMESVMARVEWSTLLFFAALFILMESLSLLGLIDWIGKQTEMIILSVSEESRLAVAILLILWVSAIASAFVDNIPLTTMMVKVAISLAENEELDLPLQPLIWALAFGACLGGNGTLIGASANVVCAGVAEQHGYRFTFIEYFKVGFPIMIGHIIVITGYLMVCHVVVQWH